MRWPLSTRTTLSIATTLAAVVALVVVLATGSDHRSAPSVAQTAAQPATPPSTTAQTTSVASPKPSRPLVARLNRHPHATVKGKPNSGAPPPVPYPPGTPRSLSGSNPAGDAAAARKVIVSELGAQDSVREPTIMADDCAGGLCRVAFRVDAHGGGLIYGQLAPLLRLLFTDSHVQAVHVLVYHSKVGPPSAGKLPLYDVTCDRSAAGKLAAGGWSYSAVSRYCRVVTGAPGAAGA